jgi:hypothetical protein
VLQPPRGQPAHRIAGLEITSLARPIVVNAALIPYLQNATNRTSRSL